MALVEVPADVTRLVLREHYGQVGDHLYHEASWTDTRAKQVAQGYKWALRWTPMPLSEFLRQAGLQGRSDIYQEAGQWVNRYRDRGTAPVGRDARTILGDPVFDFTPRTEVVTRIVVLWDWDDAHQQYRKSQELISTAQERRIDQQRGRRTPTDDPFRLELRWIRDDATALKIGQYWLGQKDRQHLTVAIRGAWEALFFEKGDLFKLENQAVMTAYGPTWFRVRSKEYALATDEIVLLGVEEASPVIELSAQARVKLARSLQRTAQAKARTFRLLDAQARVNLPSLVFRRPPLHITTR